VKVIFLQDVPDVARAGEVKDVADGYGRNFLIPQNLAVLASPSAINVLEAQSKSKARVQAQTESELTELAGQLEGKEIMLKARVGAKERLYGSITTADIAEGISSAEGLVVDKRKIELAEPIHQVGSYEVTIRLARDIVPKIKVTVAGEEAVEEVKEKTEKKAKEKTEKKTKEKTEKKAKEKTEKKTKEKTEKKTKAKVEKKTKAKVEKKTEKKAKKKAEEVTEEVTEEETEKSD
jgi:large subunit ribosomal protein L9